MSLVIIDYGMGNIHSLKSTFNYLNCDQILLSNNYEKINRAKKLILPGVGSFVSAMKIIKDLKLDLILNEMVLQKKKPILGICLGMQLLCKSSEEDGGADGLGFIQTTCKKLKKKNLKLPHVGFNQVKINPNEKIYKGLGQEKDFYFTHTYRLEKNEDINSSTCNYGEEFIASYEVDNIVGTQFHPELSQTNGLKLLKNFIERF